MMKTIKSLTLTQIIMVYYLKFNNIHKQKFNKDDYLMNSIIIYNIII